MFDRRILLPALLALSIPAVSFAADLQIHIEGIRKQEGLVNVVLMGSAEAWEGSARPARSIAAAPDGDGTLSLRMADLAPGNYALRVMHDENANGKFDTNLVGMPTEGYGFSNTPRVMRAATFEEARFEVVATGTTERISLR